MLRSLAPRAAANTASERLLLNAALSWAADS